MFEVCRYYTMSVLDTVTQSVANCVKRSLLIMATIIYFGNPITAANVAGMLMVIAGVFVYSQATRMYPPPVRWHCNHQRNLERRLVWIPRGLIDVGAILLPGAVQPTGCAGQRSGVDRGLQKGSV